MDFINLLLLPLYFYSSLTATYCLHFTKYVIKSIFWLDSIKVTYVKIALMKLIIRL